MSFVKALFSGGVGGGGHFGPFTVNTKPESAFIRPALCLGRVTGRVAGCVAGRAHSSFVSITWQDLDSDPETLVKPILILIL